MNLTIFSDKKFRSAISDSFYTNCYFYYDDWKDLDRKRKRKKNDRLDRINFKLGQCYNNDIIILTNGEIDESVKWKIAPFGFITYTPYFERENFFNSILEYNKLVFDQLRTICFEKYSDGMLGSELESYHYMECFHVSLFHIGYLNNYYKEEFNLEIWNKYARDNLDEINHLFDEYNQRNFEEELEGGQKKLLINYLTSYQKNFDVIIYVGSYPGYGWRLAHEYLSKLHNVNQKIYTIDPRENENGYHLDSETFYSRVFDFADLKLGGKRTAIIWDVRGDWKNTEQWNSALDEDLVQIQKLLDIVRLYGKRIEYLEIKVRVGWKLKVSSYYNVLPQNDYYTRGKSMEMRLCVFPRIRLPPKEIEIKTLGVEKLSEDDIYWILKFKKWIYMDYVEFLQITSKYRLTALATMSNVYNEPNVIRDVIRRHDIVFTYVIGNGEILEYQTYRDNTVPSFYFLRSDYNCCDILTYIRANGKVPNASWFETIHRWMICFPIEDEITIQLLKIQVNDFQHTRFLKELKSIVKLRFMSYEAELLMLRRAFLLEQGCIDLKDVEHRDQLGKQLEPVTMSGHIYKLILLSTMSPVSFYSYFCLILSNVIRYGKNVKLVTHSQKELFKDFKNIKVDYDTLEYHFPGIWHGSKDWILGLMFGLRLIHRNDEANFLIEYIPEYDGRSDELSRFLNTEI